MLNINIFIKSAYNLNNNAEVFLYKTSQEALKINNI